jgi:hypothetical protein
MNDSEKRLVNVHKRGVLLPVANVRSIRRPHGGSTRADDRDDNG